MQGCSRIVGYGPQVPGLTRSVWPARLKHLRNCSVQSQMTTLTSWHSRPGILREISRLGLSSGAVLSTATAVSSTLVFASTSAGTADNSVDSNTFGKKCSRVCRCRCEAMSPSQTLIFGSGILETNISSQEQDVSNEL